MNDKQWQNYFSELAKKMSQAWACFDDEESEWLEMERRNMIESSERLYIQRTVPEAIIPTRGSANAAGIDLYAAYPYSIGAKQQKLVSTGLVMALPKGMVGYWVEGTN